MISLEVAIRPADWSDVPAMGRVWHRAALMAAEGVTLPGTLPIPTADEVAEEWRRSMEDVAAGALALVAVPAERDGDVVGTIAVMPDPRDSARGELAGLHVDPDHWGQGIGRALHDAAIEHLSWAGYRVAMLWVVEGNLRARAMFERWGWRITGGRRSEIPGADELCYLRSL